jgi:hypothetical protein
VIHRSPAGFEAMAEKWSTKYPKLCAWVATNIEEHKPVGAVQPGDQTPDAVGADQKTNLLKLTHTTPPVIRETVIGINREPRENKEPRSFL